MPNDKEQMEEQCNKFRDWMSAQKKSNGEPYSSNTINNYAGALKSETAKLGLNDTVSEDLFFYTTLGEFEKAYSTICDSHNFKNVDAGWGMALIQVACFITFVFSKNWRSLWD